MWTDCWKKAEDARVPHVAAEYKTIHLKFKISVLINILLPEFADEMMLDRNDCKDYRQTLDSISYLISKKCLLPASLTNQLMSVHGHLTNNFFFQCIFCNQSILSTKVHKCNANFGHKNECSILLPDLKKCKYKLSQSEDYHHHRNHSFCENSCCNIHENIFRNQEFKNVVYFHPILEDYGKFSMFQIDCSKFNCPDKKRDHFLRVSTFISTNFNCSSYSICKCTNHCLCASNLHVRDNLFLQSKNCKKQKNITSIIEDIRQVESNERFRVMGFDTFSISQTKHNSNSKNKQSKGKCGLPEGLRNFKSCYKKLCDTDQIISLHGEVFKRKTMFIMSCTFSDYLHVHQKDHPVFSKTVLKFKVTYSEDDKLICEQICLKSAPVPVEMRSCFRKSFSQTNKLTAKNLLMSPQKVSQDDEEDEDDENDDIIIPVKHKRKNESESESVKKRRVVFRSLGKEPLFSDTELNWDKVLSEFNDIKKNKCNKKKDK